MAEAFKFVHAGDFHLDQPIQGLVEIPPIHKSALVEAPYTAAQRVFDLTIAERADFLLLAGDLFSWESGSCRAIAFLLSQFQRLREKNIAVYWCGGETDHPNRWPNTVELPDNVVRFSSQVVEEATHCRSDKVVAAILGCGFDPRRDSGGDFLGDTSDVFQIALVHGTFSPGKLSGKPVRYWAIGGSHSASIVDHDGSLVAHAGTPQGRSGQETGIGSCFLVRVGTTGSPTVHRQEIDTVRWLSLAIEIAENASMDELKEVLSERALTAISENSERLILAQWHLSTTGEFNPLLRNETRLIELRDWLRREFGSSPHGLWTVKLAVDSPAALPESWYEEDTILGDYLRGIGRFQSDSSLKLGLDDYLPKTATAEDLSSFIRVADEEREALMGQSTLLGIDYLAVGGDFDDRHTIQKK